MLATREALSLSIFRNPFKLAIAIMNTKGENWIPLSYVDAVSSNFFVNGLSTNR